jgi:hypothetical protein
VTQAGSAVRGRGSERSSNAERTFCSRVEHRQNEERLKVGLNETFAHLSAEVSEITGAGSAKRGNSHRSGAKKGGERH